MNMNLTIGSLFAGIGGLELGLERAGVGHTVWQVEQDEYCRAVLATHWPEAQRFNDVRTVGVHNLAPVDVICGGFPCQDISYAGSGAGLAGERSGLWYEFARIVRDLRPRYVVVENVAALLTRGIGRVLSDLATLGYDAEWSCVQALDVGAPHIRDRLFVVAYAASDLRRTPRNVRPAASHRGRTTLDDSDRGGRSEPEVVSQQPRRTKVVSNGQDMSHAQSFGREQGNANGRRGSKGSTASIGAGPWGGGWWSVEPDVGRVAHGIPERVDRLKALGNSVVPQVAEVVGRVILALEAERAA